jgi:hypothetical protein
MYGKWEKAVFYYRTQYFIKNFKHESNINDICNLIKLAILIKKLIKRRHLFHLVLINKCNVRMFSKITLVINSIYSGQQQFSYITLPVKNTCFDKPTRILRNAYITNM